jgi:hypothetical protein
MTDVEVDRLIKKLEKYGARVAKSKKKSKEFLIGAGIITPEGNLTSPYKHLCIPPEQA